MQTFEFPFAFLSGLFVAPATMPPVVSTIAEWNPLSSTAAATRDLFGNPGWGGDSWVAEHSVLMAVVWPLVDHRGLRAAVRPPLPGDEPLTTRQNHQNPTPPRWLKPMNKVCSRSGASGSA